MFFFQWFHTYFVIKKLPKKRSARSLDFTETDEISASTGIKQILAPKL